MSNPKFKVLHPHTSDSRTLNFGFGLANLKGKLRGLFSNSKNEKILKELAEIKSNQIKILENQNPHQKETLHIVLKALKSALDDTSPLCR